ncbi:MAG: hypothetical protein F4X65_03140 [Chloroflexi bacterium]|nr:hypothetical protein [Chloroflexota bacterium]
MSLEWLNLGIPYGWLAVPLGITTISAVAQVVAKLRARKILNGLRADLESARMRHRRLLTEYFLRQQFLCRQLQISPPDRPASTYPQLPVEEGEDETLKSRLLKKVHWRRPKTTLTQGSTGSAKVIVGRHSLSVGWSFVWRTTGSNIMRVAQPLGSRAATFAPRLITFGGGAASTGGSLAASTAVRAVIGAVSVVGWVIGPALAAWTVFSEARKIGKARQELRILLYRQDSELASFRVRNRRLEAQFTELTRVDSEEKDLVAAYR